MGAPKGRPKPEGSGIKAGQKARKTIEREMVVAAWVALIHEHTEYIFNKLLETNPAALATFLGKIAPKNDNLNLTNNMPVIVRLPVVEESKDTNGSAESNTAESGATNDTTGE